MLKVIDGLDRMDKEIMTEQERLTDAIIHTLALCDEVGELSLNVLEIDFEFCKCATEAKISLHMLSFMLCKRAKEMEEKAEIENQ
jgi:hypothetical protein